MDKVRLPHSYKVYLPLVLLFAVMLLLIPKTENFNYDYRKGAPWMYETLMAQFDFPILKTDEQLREEKESAGTKVVPYCRFLPDVAGIRLRSLENLDLGAFSSLRPQFQNILADIYQKGVIADRTDAAEGYEIIFIQKDKRVSEYPVAEVYTESRARLRLASVLRSHDPSCNADSICAAVGLYDAVTPNIVYDQQLTELVHQQQANYISPTSGVVYAGQMIVAEGELVTAEIQQLLDSYKAEYDANLGYGGPLYLLWIGDALIALILVILLFFTIYYSNFKVFSDINRYLYLVMVTALAAAVTFAVERLNPGFLYLVPFPLFALYLLAFFKKRVVLPVYIILLLPLLVFCHNGIELFIMNVAAGVTAIFSFTWFYKGWQQFLTAFFVFLILVFTFTAFRIVDGIKAFHDYKLVGYMGLASLFSVAGYPLIYLFEKVFMLVSNSRLVELSDTNNKLLRLLAHKAPGTFQHSLQVMNMADAAARSIDANVLLVRAGALYHDIGKTNNPQCFIENETLGAHYHSGLTPRESAKEIIRHVSDGMALAEKYNLPDVIKDFITTHHGTTCTAYFYNKYLNDGGDSSDVAAFYYNGRKPTTKEQIVIMLCDTLEAASRSLKDYSQESIAELVDRIVDSKMKDGQFSDADISLKEINVVSRVLKEYLQQVYHARVAYPKRITDKDN